MKDADDALSARHEEERAALSTIRDLVYIYDEEFRLVYGNDAFLEAFGVPLNELRGTRIRDFLQDDEIAAIVESQILNVIRNGEPAYGILPYSSPIGVSAHFEYQFHRYQHSAGTWVVGATRDVSDRVRLSRQVEEKNKELTAILESITDAFYALDSEFRFTYVNQRATELLQRSGGELIGSSLKEEFPETFDSPLYSEYQRAMAEQTSSTFEFYYEPLETWFEVHAYPSQDLLSVYFRDINEQVRMRQELVLNERRYRTSTNAMPQMVWLTDSEGNCLYYNDRWYEFTGLTEEESLGSGLIYALHPADRERTLQAWEQAWRHGQSFEIEYRFYSRELDEYRWFLGRAYPVTDDNGEIVEWVGTCTDIEPQKRAEEQLRESERRLEDAQRIAQIGNWEFNLKTGAFSCSNECKRIFGFDPEGPEMGQDAYFQRIQPDDRALILNQRARVLERGQGGYDIEYRIFHPNGEEHILHTLAELATDQDGAPERLIGTVHDITHRREIEQSLEEYARQRSIMSRQLQQLNSTLEQQVEERTAELRRLSENLERMVWERTAELEESRAQLAHQAQHDQLTGLPNRSLFEDRLGHAIANADRSGNMVGVLFMDLDGFKLVNDTFGHAAGDQVLKAIVLRLQARIRRYDTLARHGGDEFVAVLENVFRPEDAYSITRDFLNAVNHPVTVADRSISLSASIGVAFYPQDAQTVSGLQRHADIAMYRAKLSGKNDVRFYSPSMNAAAEERQEIASHLLTALENNELQVHYQPQINASSEKVESFEALLRWNNPILGSVSPARLIPIAEETGLIIPIGSWVLNESCRQAAVWTDRTGQRIGVSINVSAMQLDRHDFVDLVSTALDRHKLVPSQLELEVTETSVIQNLAHAIERMNQLRTLGVRIAIDDFSLESSSLSNLVRLPIDTVKIDREFVRELTESQAADRVVQAIVALANGIGLSVVAEGVEKESQRDRVVALGCERLQGYLFGYPVDADSTLQLLDESTT